MVGMFDDPNFGKARIYQMQVYRQLPGDLDIPDLPHDPQSDVSIRDALIDHLRRTHLARKGARTPLEARAIDRHENAIVHCRVIGSRGQIEFFEKK